MVEGSVMKNYLAQAAARKMRRRCGSPLASQCFAAARVLAGQSGVMLNGFGLWHLVVLCCVVINLNIFELRWV